MCRWGHAVWTIFSYPLRSILHREKRVPIALFPDKSALSQTLLPWPDPPPWSPTDSLWKHSHLLLLECLLWCFCVHPFPPNPDNCDFKICLYSPTRLFLLAGTVHRLVCFSKSEWPRSPVSMPSRLCTKFAPVFRIPVVPRWSLRMGTCKRRVEDLELLGFGKPLTLTHR